MATVAQLEARLNELEKKQPVLGPPQPSWFSSIAEKVFISITTAVALAALTLLWNWASKGGVVRLLGGITAAEAKDIVVMTIQERSQLIFAELTPRLRGAPGERGPSGPQGERGPPGLSGSGSSIPANAVVAFKEPCAKGSGWSEYADAAGRFVIGVNLDQRRGTLRGSATQGGSETAGLIAANLPQHKHHGRTTGTSGTIPYQPNQMPSGTGRNYAPASVLSQPDPMVEHGHTIETDGGDGLEGKRFEIMPPYVALYYCQKE